MPSDAARAELGAACARWLAHIDEPTFAVARLRSAAADADVTIGENADRGQLIVVVRARRAVREVTRRLGNPAGLPLWATASLIDEHAALFDIIGSGDWPAIIEAVRTAADELSSPELEGSMAVAEALFPRHRAFGVIRLLRNEINSVGLEVTLRRLQTDYDRDMLLNAWIGTNTWTKSFDFLREHKDELSTPEVHEILDRSPERVSRQHLAILSLSTVETLDRTLTLVTNADCADEAALDAIEAGDLSRLLTIVLASDALRDRRSTLILAGAILAAANGDLDESSTTIDELGRSMSRLERRALTGRLRSLLRHRPELAVLDPAVEGLEQMAKD